MGIFPNFGVKIKILIISIPIGSMGLVYLPAWKPQKSSIHVGKYTSPMDPMGYNLYWFWENWIMVPYGFHLLGCHLGNSMLVFGPSRERQLYPTKRENGFNHRLKSDRWKGICDRFQEATCLLERRSERKLMGIPSQILTCVIFKSNRPYQKKTSIPPIRIWWKLGSVAIPRRRRSLDLWQSLIGKGVMHAVLGKWKIFNSMDTDCMICEYQPQGNLAVWFAISLAQFNYREWSSHLYLMSGHLLRPSWGDTKNGWGTEPW